MVVGSTDFLSFYTSCMPNMTILWVFDEISRNIISRIHFIKAPRLNYNIGRERHRISVDISPILICYGRFDFIANCNIEHLGELRHTLHYWGSDNAHSPRRNYLPSTRNDASNLSLLYLLRPHTTAAILSALSMLQPTKTKTLPKIDN